MEVKDEKRHWCNLSQQVCISQATPTYYKLKDEVVETIDAVAAMHGEPRGRRRIALQTCNVPRVRCRLRITRTVEALARSPGRPPEMSSS